MTYTPIRDLAQQGLFDITRVLLRQPDLSALVQCLTELTKCSSLADRVHVLIRHPLRKEVVFYGLDKTGKKLHYEDDMYLANGPVRRIFTGAEALICTWQEFNEVWPQVVALDLYASFGHYCIFPLTAAGKVFGGCEFIRDTGVMWSEKELHRLRTISQIVGIVTEQIQSCLDASYYHRLLCCERDNFRILVEMTNAVLSASDIDGLVGAIALEIHSHFDIDSISICLPGHDKARLIIYSTYFLYKGSPVDIQVEDTEAEKLSEQVFKRGDFLLVNLSCGEKLTPSERMLLDRGPNQVLTVCLLPLKYGKNILGVLRLARQDEKGFTPTDIKMLSQIAARIAIAVDNVQAREEVNRLKKNLVGESFYHTEHINNVECNFGEVIGCSEAMSKVFGQVEIVAKSDTTVLILGETGTGKELIARAVHNLSERNNHRMVKINCAAIPPALFESDLFGHKRGAFTGADTQRIGRFEQADLSSLFLDEVGDIPLELQPKLLRVLQEREFERLGSNRVQKVDVRLIAATNHDLKQMVLDRGFRSDLYYRLNVFPLMLPPLRERPQDIPLLAKYFVNKIARRMNRNIDCISVETLRALSRMDWPGNVRELENVIERAVLLTTGHVLHFPLPEQCHPLSERRESVSVNPYVREDENEYHRIVRALKETNGLIAGPRGAAHRLGLKRTTLLSRMKRMGIDKNGI